ncbi:hypothetical protein [Caballeronia sp. DA-9]|uniref:hypothetical protein n=1 Tax=Caballeronia sp. DA-9 TaxID=3436237 RepID=UPI003F66BBF8
MKTLDAIASLTAKLEIIRQQIDRHRQSILDLDAEAQRLAIALGVMQQLEASEGSTPTEDEFGKERDALKNYSSHLTLSAAGSSDLNAENFKVPFVTSIRSSETDLALMPPSTKHLIKSLFMSGESLSRFDVAVAVKKRKVDANAGTVATTLSKLVREGFLIREKNLYKRKDGIASGDDTGDADDLL